MIHARSDYRAIQVSPVHDGSLDAPDIPFDEPVFLIRAKDRIGPHAVNAWADLAESTGASPEIVSAARRHAERMLMYATEHYDGGKIPDAPLDQLR